MLQEYGLYYDASSGTYLNYNQETQSYEYHSQVTSAEPAKGSVRSGRTKRRVKNEKNAKVWGRQIGKDFSEELMWLFLQVNIFYHMEGLSVICTYLIYAAALWVRMTSKIHIICRSPSDRGLMSWGAILRRASARTVRPLLRTTNAFRTQVVHIFFYLL